MTKFSYQRSKVYNHVKNKFHLTNDSVFFLNYKGEFKNDDTILFQDDNIHFSYKYKELFYFWKSKDSYVYNNLTRSLLLNQLNIFPIKKVSSSNGEEYCKKVENHKTNIFKYQNYQITEKLLDGNADYIIEGLFYKILDDYLGLECYDKVKKLWNFNLANYFQTTSKIKEGRILVVEDRIIFFAHTENWDNYATFILDTKTGEVLFTTDQMGLKLYEYNKHVYQIQEKRIKILNPITTEIQTIELSEELAKRRLILEDKAACFYNNKLYTLAREENNDIYSIWLILNLETEEIEYQYEMLFDPNKKVTDENKMFITDIQANDKMIAVLGGNNLHIFEKEENL